MSGFFSGVAQYLSSGFGVTDLPLARVAAMLLVTVVLSLYEYAVYRVAARRGFYDRDFGICLAMVPAFIAAIIMTLQSNLIITLGTIGALAIVRFRTAIKNPLDMVFLLWAVTLGILTGSGLYELALILCLWATLALVLLTLLPTMRAPGLLVVNGAPGSWEEDVTREVRKNGRLCRVKARNAARDRLEVIYEVRTAKPAELLDRVRQVPGVTEASMLSHEGSELA